MFKSRCDQYSPLKKCWQWSRVGIRPCPSWHLEGDALGVRGSEGLKGPYVPYDRNRSVICIASSSSDLFLVHVGPRRGCPLSAVLFFVVMASICRHCQGVGGFQFGNHWIPSLLFADYDVLLRPSGCDLQLRGAPAEVALASISDASWTPLIRRCFKACHTGTRPQGRLGTRCSDCVTRNIE